VSDCTTEVASILVDKYKECVKLPNQCLQKLIDEKESKCNIILGSIKPNTIKFCICCNHLIGINKRLTPVLDVLEPLNRSMVLQNVLDRYVNESWKCN
jgi:hypothetical protein